MAKIIKNISISLESEENSTTFSTCRVNYTVSSSEDSSLSKTASFVMSLVGADLVDAQALLALAVVDAEAAEGI